VARAAGDGTRVSAPVVDRLTQAWVRAYTRGIRPDVRDARRAELASDLWEHRATARDSGVSKRATSFSIAARAIAGVPADLTWRHATRGAVMRAETTTVSRRGWLGITADIVATTMGAVAMLGGIGAAIGDGDSTGSGILLSLAGVALLSGAYLRTRRPVAGVALVAVGALSWSFIFSWLPPMVLVGLAVIALAVLATNRTPRSAT
jgi:hypothetical protein